MLTFEISLTATDCTHERYVVDFDKSFKTAVNKILIFTTHIK